MAGCGICRSIGMRGKSYNNLKIIHHDFRRLALEYRVVLFTDYEEGGRS